MKKFVRITGLIAGTVLYEAFFWHESMGLNSLLFFALMTGIAWYLSPESFKKTNVLITLFACFVTAALVIYYNSGTSKFAFICSFVVTLGFVFQPSLRSVPAALGVSFLNLFMAPGVLARDLKKGDRENKHRSAFSKWFRLFILPLLILTVFFFIFKAANPVFNEYANKIWNSFATFIEELFINFTFLQFLFILSGLFITISIIYKANHGFIARKENSRTDAVIRQNVKARHKSGRFSRLMALKNEYRRAAILVVSINLLVIVLNIIDINWIWFNFEIREGMDLQQLVHEGTYLLILSILLSMGIILFFFRGNLNFLAGNKLLKYGTYLWIFQNIIMVVSVALRNYHYISHYGLAYKRVGVIIFLILTIVGLITIALKIHRKKSGFFLVKANAWAVFFMMVLLATVNWDMLIAKYNIRHDYPQEIDAEFLLEMSDCTLPVLVANRDKIATESEMGNFFYDRLREKVFLYKLKQQDKTWLSWTYADSHTKNELISLNKF